MPLACLLLGLWSAVSDRAFGQVTPVGANLQLNLSNPGARSLALGGAFVGLADDATAAYTNPAGLTNLTRPEISVEGRYFQFFNTFLNTGNGTGAPLVDDNGNPVTTVPDHLVYSESKDTRTALSFASFVYPGKGWAVALYRHELADFKASSQVQGAFFNDAEGFLNRFFPYQAGLDFKVVNYGLALAVQLGHVSLGAGVSRFELHSNENATYYDIPQDQFFNPINLSTATPIFTDHVNGDDHAVAFNAGVLWKVVPQFSIGAVYRQGPKFTTTENFVDLTDASNNFVATTELHIPDIYGAGIAVRPIDVLTITADWNRVRYSQLISPTVFVSDNPPSTQPSSFTVDDADQYRVGVQWAIPLGAAVLAIRGGWWHDPDHKLHAAGPVDPTSTDSIANHLAFPPGETVNHYTGGLGLAISEHFQFDAGFDYSTTVKTASASLVGRF
jgi:long-subunit fatty acid transport protein